MTRACIITNKRTIFGKNVSHANNKTSRTFKSNLKYVKIKSKLLNTKVKIRVSAKGLRIIDKLGFEKAITKFNKS